MMDQDWKDFNKNKPSFTTIQDDIKMSDQILICINDKIYVGYYTSSLFYNADEDKEEWDQCLEIAKYSLDCIAANYLQVDNIYSSDFNKYDIYWHYIDTLGIICSVDLQKMQREEEKDDDIKTRR